MDHESVDSNKSALNRSYSFSGSPISQKLCVEQSYQNKRGETLIRQYSCEHIYDFSNKNPKIQFKESVFLHSPRKLKNLAPALDDTANSLFNTSYSTNQPSLNFQSEIERFPFNSGSNNFFNFHKNCPEQEGFEKSLNHIRNTNKEIQLLDCIPMEVDTSVEDHSMSDVHFPCKMEGDIELSENEEHKSKVSKMIIPPNQYENTNATKNSGKSFKQYLKFITVFLIPIICALILKHSEVFVEESYASNNFDANNITNALQNLLYGQQQVLQKLKESFHNIHDNNLIVFTGGVGVGKTYSANIISNNFPWKRNIIKFVSPQNKNEYDTTYLNSLSDKGYNLIIIDNLEYDNQSVMPFVKKILSFSKRLIVILIYTVPERSFDISKESNLNLLAINNKISENLNNENVKHTLITFNKLNADIVRKCIHYAMSKKGLLIDQLIVDKILGNVNYEYSGCKGVYRKVALLG